MLHTKYREILQTVAGDSIGIFSNLNFTNMLYVAHIHVYVIEHTFRNIALFDPNLQITYTVFTFTYTMLVKQAKQKMTLSHSKKFKTPKSTNPKIHQTKLHTQCIP